MDIAFGGGGLRITANVAYRKDKRILSAEIALGGIAGEASPLKGNKCTKVPNQSSFSCTINSFASLSLCLTVIIETQTEAFGKSRLVLTNKCLSGHHGSRDLRHQGYCRGVHQEIEG